MLPHKVYPGVPLGPQFAVYRTYGVQVETDGRDRLFV